MGDRVPLPTEDIHTPNPHPARGIYGFALYVTGWIALVLYLIWAIVPTPVLRSFGITYVPAKYWAIAVPLLLPILIVIYLTTLFLINCYRLHGIFDNVEKSRRPPRPSNPIRHPRMLLSRRLNLYVTRISQKFARRRTERSGQHTDPQVEHSRGSQVTEIHRRLAEYERLQTVASAKESEYAVESMIAERKMIGEPDKFSKVLNRRKQEQIAFEETVSTRQEGGDSINFPLAQHTTVNPGSAYNLCSTSAVTTASSSGNDSFVDRGFYIEGDQYIDEYLVGTTQDLPENEMTVPSRSVYGSEDAVEHIDFQMPGQALHESTLGSNLEEDLSDGLKEQSGTVDAGRAVSKKKCGGCGANFHCKDGSLPGFVPMEILDRVERRKKDSNDTLCRRCHLLKHHDFLLNVNVCAVDYASMMSHLKLKEEALILLVVDVTDIQGSIHKQLPHIIGERKPMIVVANKVDLLPPDAQCGYLKRFKIAVEKAIDDAGFTQRFNVLHTALVSAKTGYGLEALITEIHLKCTNVKYGMRADLYLVGCTNAGKSTLFNAFLQSDLCKVRAVDLVERATTSVWPGTTISLLKFPVMKPSPYKLELRQRRLLANRAWQQKENYARKLILQQTGDSKYAVLTETLQNTYKEAEEELQPMSRERLMGMDEQDGTTRNKPWSPDDPVFAKGTWCYDTPGTVNQDQLLNIFTLSELVKVLPRSLISPRTALVSPGHSLLIGGVGVVDVLSTQRGDAVYLTAFASSDLPLNVIPTRDVQSFLSKHQITGALAVPEGGEERLALFPKLESKEFCVKGRKREGAADLVLSSVGWVLVTGYDRSIDLRTWSPGGKGLAIRDPIMPYAADLRGKRIPETRFYKVKPVEFPVNQKRKSGGKKRRRRMEL